MKRRQYILLVALTIVAGLVGGAVSNWVLVARTAVAQTQRGSQESAEFDTVTCRSLRIVDESGRVCAILEKVARNPSMDDVIRVFNRNDVVVDAIGVAFGSGIVATRYKDGTGGTFMFSKTEGGAVTVFGKDGSPRVAMSVNEKSSGFVLITGKDKGNVHLSTIATGGIVGVFGRDGGGAASMALSSEGGTVTITGKDGKARIAMSVDENSSGSVLISGKDRGSVHLNTNAAGGTISVFGNDWKILTPLAVIHTDSNGGALGIIGNDGKTRILMGVNEYGNGCVNTWDKHGYRLPD